MSEYKIVVTGNNGVGKSNMVLSLVQAMFVDGFDPTIEDSYRKRVTIDDKTCLLDILDTYDCFEDVTNHFRRGYETEAKAVILLYDITNRISFEELHKHRQRIEEIRQGRPVAWVVCGTKRDLANERRQVDAAEGHAWAQNISAAFFEISAKQQEGIDEAFFESVRLARQAEDQDARLAKRRSPGCISM